MHPLHLIRNRKLWLLAGLVAGALVPSVLVVTAQGPKPGQTSHAATVSSTGFTYQGQLKKNGNPVNDVCNMDFSLWDSQGTGSPPTGGTKIGSTQSMSVTVTNGLFTVQLNAAGQIGFSLFRGDDRWLQAAVRCTSDSSAVTLTRQQVTAVPYALSLIPGAEIIGPPITGLYVESTYPGGNGLVGVADKGTQAYGVYGTSSSGYGVVGGSNLGYGVFGYTSVITGAGVLARSVITSGTALEIRDGGIKATGAGGDTNTFAFIHVSTGTTISGSETLINNALTNGDQNAMLFVTHVNNPTLVSANTFNQPFGVIYDTSVSKWAIYTEDGSPFPNNPATPVTFNVMVIKR